MQIHRDIDNIPAITKPVITIGTFDGVHKAHREIIQSVKDKAEAIGGESALVTFHPHPRQVLFPENEMKLLTVLEEKIDILQSLKLDHLIIIPFTKGFSQLSGAQFVEQMLVSKIHPGVIIIGYNHHFGKDRKGNYEFLKSMEGKYNFEVQQIPKRLVDDMSVSSTKVRNALAESNIKVANNLLGYEYFIRGVVTKGNQLGKKIGFPTANVHVKDKAKLIPANGSYAVKVEHSGQLYHGMLNIGIRPTVKGTEETIEVHIFDFEKDIYGEELTVYFIDKIRDEEKFNDLEDLRKQLIKDKEQSIRLLENSLI